MGILEDVMKTLERLPAWRRVSDLPQEVEELKARIAALEAKLGPQPGAKCAMCKGFSMQITSSAPHPDFGSMGLKLDTLQCSVCGFEEQHERNPAEPR